MVTILATTKTRLYFPYPAGPKILPAKTFTTKSTIPLKNIPKKDHDNCLKKSFIVGLISCPKTHQCTISITTIIFCFQISSIKYNNQDTRNKHQTNHKHQKYNDQINFKSQTNYNLLLNHFPISALVGADTSDQAIFFQSSYISFDCFSILPSPAI